MIDTAVPSPFSLDSVYADPAAARALENREKQHRALVEGALQPGEPVYACWWDTDFSGLILATDRRILQFPKIKSRRAMFLTDLSFDVWQYGYDTLDQLTITPGSFFEYTRIVLHRPKTEDALIVITRSRLPAAVRDRLETFTATIERLAARWNADPALREAALEAAAAVPSSSLAVQLRELHDLFKDGALTEEEFDRAKQQLLTG